MPFRKFRSRLSSNLSQESAISRSTDDQSWGRRSFEHPPVVPRVRSTHAIGIVGDPSYNHECAGSARFGNRTLWTWRDTQMLDSKTGRPQQSSLLSSTASWTDHKSDESPVFLHDFQKTTNLSVRLESSIPQKLMLQHYGEQNTDRAFYRIIQDGCEPKAGIHKDGTRRALWPNTAPLVTKTSESGKVTAYAWVQKTHLKRDGSVATSNPATTMYKLIYAPSDDKNALPRVNVIDGNFWNENEIPYGTYGSLVKDNIAYLFARVGSTGTAVARVLVDLIERKSGYEYFVNGDWTKARPAMNDLTIDISNANTGGQGTFYWSEAWLCYVWIGGDASPGADCYISTAPAATGPWTYPFIIYQGETGTHSLQAQSVQAHPSLLRDGEGDEGMYLSYTKCDLGPRGEIMYSTHLVYIEWDNDDSSD